MRPWNDLFADKIAMDLPPFNLPDFSQVAEAVVEGDAASALRGIPDSSKGSIQVRGRDAIALMAASAMAIRRSIGNKPFPNSSS